MEVRPKISVVIPIYNVEAYLSRCLESVVNQTLLDIEIICVNDGTKDHSVDVVKKYKDIDDWIQLVEKKNGGLASARNAGMKVATGQMILFLDSDDYLALNACERLYEEYLNHKADIIVFGSTPFPEIPEPDPWILWRLDCRDVYYPEFEPEALFEEPCGQPFAWNRAFSLDYLRNNKLTFPENVLFGEDIVFMFECMPMAGSVQFIEDKLHFYQYFRQGSLMFRYGADVDKKMLQHVKNMKVITAFWHEHGFIEKWGKDFVEWYLEFLVPDLIEYKPSNCQYLAQSALRIMQKYDLMPYLKKSNSKVKNKYRKLVKIAKKS